jgi:hypothetical protein
MACGGRYDSLAFVLLIFSYQIQLGKFEELKVLNMMGFLPMGGNILPFGHSCLPSMDMAMEHIDARTDILDGYKLSLTWRDTEVKHSRDSGSSGSSGGSGGSGGSDISSYN